MASVVVVASAVAMWASGQGRDAAVAWSVAAADGQPVDLLLVVDATQMPSPFEEVPVPAAVVVASVSTGAFRCDSARVEATLRGTTLTVVIGRPRFQFGCNDDLLRVAAAVPLTRYGDIERVELVENGHVRMTLPMPEPR